MGGVGAVAFFAFEPNLLAHGTLATTDMGLTVFMTLAMAAWARFTKGDDLRFLGLAGFAAGAALCSKATGLALVPAMLASLVWSRGKARKEEIPAFAALCAIAGFTVLLVYKPSQIHRFFEMTAYRAGAIQTRHATPIFLFGKPYADGHPLYFPAMILAKTTLPLLALAAWSGLRRKEAASLGALLIIAAMAGRMQTGVRYVLPLYPLLCLCAGDAAEGLWRRGGRRRLLAAAAWSWHALSALSCFPFPLAYVNELFGSPANAWWVSSDSNVDWGRVVPEIKPFLEKNPGGLILSYFGMDCPREHGLSFQDAFSTPGVCPGASGLLPAYIGREWLAVSATKWQGYPEGPSPAWGWLRTRTPAANLGYALFVYDVTLDADAHLRLAEMYERAGQSQAARRERARAAFIFRASSRGGR